MALAPDRDWRVGRFSIAQALSTAIRDEPHLSYIFKFICIKLGKVKVLCNMDLSVDREPGPGPAQGLSHMFFTPQPGEDKGDDLATVL